MRKNKKGEVSVVISIDTEGPIKNKRNQKSLIVGPKQKNWLI